MEQKFDEYIRALDGAGPKLKELILDRAAYDLEISLFSLRVLVSRAYPDGGTNVTYRILQMTNADRIRSMSDEELAEFLVKVDDCPCGICCDNMDRCLRNNAPEPVCKRHFLDWLQRQAGEMT